MTIAIREAPTLIGAKFDRAMTILAAMPGRNHSSTEYRHIGPFPRRVLEGIPRSEADLAAPYSMGWQYLVQDADGYGVLDISGKPEGSYSSFRRGSFALGYFEALEAAQADASSTPGVHELEIVDIPSAFTLLITMRAQELTLYPAFFRGKRIVPSSRTLGDLQSLRPGDFHRDDGGPSLI